MTKDIRIFICRKVPRKGFPAKFGQRLFGIVVRIRDYLLIGTSEPHRPEDASVYLVHNDDLRIAFMERYGLAIAKRHYASLPVGQVTKVPVDCCEIKPHLPKELP